MQSLWNKLTPFSKEYFDSQLKKLVDKNKYNMYLNAIYHLISGILVIVLFVFIYNIESLKGDIKGFKRDPGHDEDARLILELTQINKEKKAPNFEQMRGARQANFE